MSTRTDTLTTLCPLPPGANPVPTVTPALCRPTPFTSPDGSLWNLEGGMSIINQDYRSINALMPTLLPHTTSVYMQDFNFVVPESTTLSLATNESTKTPGSDLNNILKSSIRTFINEYISNSTDLYNGATFGCMLTTPLIVKNSISDPITAILNSLEHSNNSGNSLKGILLNGIRSAIYMGSISKVSSSAFSEMTTLLSILVKMDQ